MPADNVVGNDFLQFNIQCRMLPPFHFLLCFTSKGLKHLDIFGVLYRESKHLYFSTHDTNDGRDREGGGGQGASISLRRPQGVIGLKQECTRTHW